MGTSFLPLWLSPAFFIFFSYLSDTLNSSHSKFRNIMWETRKLQSPAIIKVSSEQHKSITIDNSSRQNMTKIPSRLLPDNINTRNKHVSSGKTNLDGNSNITKHLWKGVSPANNTPCSQEDGSMSYS